MDIPFARKTGSSSCELVPQHALPFTYLPKKVVLGAIGGRSSASLYDAIQKGNFPPPDKIGSRSLWRSDVIAAWLVEQAEKAEAERNERAKVGRDQAQRLVKARQSPSAPTRAA